ncbi:MAG: agmatinase, partial [Litorimonas sp.]
MTSEINNIDLAFTRKAGSGTLSEPTFSGALSFARRRYSKDLKGCDLAVIGLPYDLATTARPGARFGPRAVREASAMIAWDRVHGWEFDPFENLSIIDYGDVLFDAGVPASIPDVVEAQFKTVHSAGVKTLMLGGDHFSTYPVLKSLVAVEKEPISLIHFDAHSDTWEDDGQRIDHGTMFYHAAKQGLVDPSRSVQIGIRTFNEKTHGFNILSAEDVRRQGTESVINAVHDIVGDRPAYITFDIDCLDPSMAPGTGTPVIGGLTTMEAQIILRGLRGINLRSSDVVEVAPAYDHAQITALAGATIAMNLVALFAAGK